ncbi:MAG TPA: YdeI/OmpD-associated family protein [Thermoanaerobaculia bacterium]|nr:YdeI/OmpD-associated family protein [Thermoanaerobaculia bacterium]
MSKPTFFATPAAFRRWLEKHHESASELIVGFHKKGSGKPSITWPESVDEALCFGWIDGIRRRIDDDSYSIRFTPRRPDSIWSKVNFNRMGELTAAGRVHPVGLAAFAKRSADKTGVYSYEHQRRPEVPLDSAYEKQLRKNKAAWQYLQDETPWYRRIATRWIMEAKKEETREKRLRELIELSAAGRRIKGVAPRGKGG